MSIKELDNDKDIKIEKLINLDETFPPIEANNIKQSDQNAKLELPERNLNNESPQKKATDTTPKVKETVKFHAHKMRGNFNKTNYNNVKLKKEFKNGRPLQRNNTMKVDEMPVPHKKDSDFKNPFCPSRGIESFKVDDFFRCLKTPESQHHLAPWSPELDKKCSSFTTPTNPGKRGDNFLSGETHGVKDFTKYKTELCRSYQYNRRCDYGDECLYAHGIMDLKQSPRHPKYRSKKCYSFHLKGFCLYGSRCQFLHDIE